MRNRGFALFFLLLSSFFALAACSNSTKVNNNEQTEKKSTAAAVQTISTDDLKTDLGKKDWLVIDTRSNDAFNGWPLDGVKRGGHIKGAVDFSANWLNVSDDKKDEKLKSLLKSKGITPNKKIVLYDANGKDANNVASFLSKQGFKQIYTYDVNAWAANKDLPMESYPNYKMLVPSSAVNDIINGNNSGKPYKIFEASWGTEAKDYKAGHIPGAVHIDTDEVEEGPVWNRLKDPELEKFALKNGITKDTTVVLYGSDSMASFRVAVILKYMGVNDVRVLNGGFASWKNAGYQIETKVNSKQAVTSFGTTVPANPNFIVDMPEAKKILADKKKNSYLVDIRSWNEFIGKTSGYDYIKPKGRPAGSIWGHAGSDANHLEDFRNIDNTMRNGNEILAMWKKSGIDPNKQLTFYCGTGWRASEVLFYADVMGLKHIAEYDGGWNEWSMNPANPVETGAPKK
jgi:molybdopterin synthase sulfurtransferase